MKITINMVENEKEEREIWTSFTGGLKICFVDLNREKSAKLLIMYLQTELKAG